MPVIEIVLSGDGVDFLVCLMNLAKACQQENVPRAIEALAALDAPNLSDYGDKLDSQLSAILGRLEPGEEF
jgi:hypothetical protein